MSGWYSNPPPPWEPSQRFLELAKDWEGIPRGRALCPSCTSIAIDRLADASGKSLGGKMKVAKALIYFMLWLRGNQSV